MKKLRVLLTMLPGLLYFACHNPPAPADANLSQTTDTLKRNYFPVRDFLKAEIGWVDSFPQKLMEYQSQNGKTDSAIITTQTFNRLAAAFLLNDLDSNRFEKRFDETSFLDQTTNLLTFTYSTKDSSYGLRRVDVLAVPGQTADKVRSIYLEVSSGNADSLVLSKMYWKTRKSFSILQIYKPIHGQTSTSQIKVEWGSD